MDYCPHIFVHIKTNGESSKFFTQTKLALAT